MHLIRELVDVSENALGTLQDYTPGLHLLLVIVVLSTFLFGVLTVLSAVSMYFLLRKGLQSRAVVLLLASILVLYSSTAAYWAAIIANAANANMLLEDAVGGLLDPSHSTQVGRYHSRVLTQSIVATTSLAINMVLGDTIVWWRAYILWRTRSVLGLGCVVVVLTAALGIAGAVCDTFNPEPHPTLSLLYSDVTGIMFAFVSLVTNIMATALIAIKAWQHRQLLLAFVGKGGGSPEVMRAFILLIESGTFYSVLWIVVAIYEALSLKYPDNNFVCYFSFFVYGCLTVIIAIYPTMIIFLVAINRSHLEATFGEESVTPVSTHIGPFARTTTATESFDVFSGHQIELSVVPIAPSGGANTDGVKIM